MGLAALPGNDSIIHVKLSRFYNVSPSSKGLTLFLNHFPNLDTLDFSDCSWADPLLLNKILNQFNKISRVLLTGCEKFNNLILENSKNYPNIKNVEVDFGSVSNQAVLAMAKSCPNLMTTQIPNQLKNLLELGAHCPQLSKIYLRSDEKDSHLILGQLVSYFSNLSVLEIWHEGFESNKHNALWQRDMDRLIANNSNLRSLILSSRNAAHILDVAAENCPHLAHLKITGVYDTLTDEDVKEFLQKTKLESIALEGIYDDYLHAFQECLTNDAVYAIAEHCPELRSLKLFIPFTEDSIIRIARNCSKLEAIELDGLITNRMIGEIIKGCRHTLKSISLYSHTQEPSIVAIVLLAHLCPLLKAVNISWARGSQITLGNLREKFPEIRFMVEEKTDE